MTGEQATAAAQAVSDLLSHHSPIFQNDESGWFCFDGVDRGGSDHAQFDDLEGWRAHVAPLLVAVVDGFVVEKQSVWMDGYKVGSLPLEEQGE